MTQPVRDDPFTAELRRIAAAVPQSQAAFRNRNDTTHRADETAAARLSAAATMADNQRRWTTEQMASVATSVNQGRASAPDEIDKGIAPQPSALLPDARAGLLAATDKARVGMDGIRDGGRSLLLWRARRSSIIGGIGIGALVLLALVGLFVGRRVVAARQAEATATAEAVAVITHEWETVAATRATATPEDEEPERTPTPDDDNPTPNPEDPTPRPTAAPTRTPRPTPRPSPTTAGPVADLGPELIEIGRTALGTPVEAVRFGDGDRVIVFVGGMHAGFAPATVALAQEAIAYFSHNPDEVPDGVTLFIVISASPDTTRAPGELAGRLNSNRVDANRNWGCDWTTDARFRGEVIPGSGGESEFSEPEVIALRDFILNNGAAAVVFWEARAEGGLVSPGNCGSRTEVSSRLASTYGAAAGYRVADFEIITNQELNGDSTNWLDSIGVPAISVLLPSYESTDRSDNLEGMRAVLGAFGG